MRSFEEHLVVFESDLFTIGLIHFQLHGTLILSFNTFRAVEIVFVQNFTLGIISIFRVSKLRYTFSFLSDIIVLIAVAIFWHDMRVIQFN